MSSRCLDADPSAKSPRDVVEAFAVTATNHPAILDHGSYESAKAAVHAVALGLGLVMGTYNTAAWIVRRRPHLFVNACLYAVFSLWEAQHVAHHLRDAE